MKTKFFTLLFSAGLLFSAIDASAENDLRGLNMTGPAVLERFKAAASKIDVGVIAALPVQSHGRVKPLDTHAREIVLFISGKYSFNGLHPIQTYLQLMLGQEESKYVDIINVRDPELREKLGFTKNDRTLSLNALEHSPLETMAQPIIQKQRMNDRSVSPDEKKVLEALQQVYAVREIIMGGNLFQAVNLNVEDKSGMHDGMHDSPVVGHARDYMMSLLAGDPLATKDKAAQLISFSRAQPMPDLFRKGLSTTSLEVFYNKARIFFWVGILYFVLAILFIFRVAETKLTGKVLGLAILTPLLFHAIGFALRVWITGFAPVTNMYGTMVWMAFGVILFGSVLFYLYRNRILFGILLLGSGATLLMTESIPLILSPDMDPIVAVLRNNFWLTIHVLTITISYAAFTIAMLIGNAASIQFILKGKPSAGFASHARIAYRAIQLGVFLITVGIILGGWWADYSWGRFWGWDPKETWALIADIGFLAILHARYVGWLGEFGLLVSAPLAYLLVIMAWYGVNFILAAGLHSYGFSSGGATIVTIFVSIQLVITLAALAKRKFQRT